MKADLSQVKNMRTGGTGVASYAPERAYEEDPNKKYYEDARAGIEYKELDGLQGLTKEAYDARVAAKEKSNAWKEKIKKAQAEKVVDESPEVTDETPVDDTPTTIITEPIDPPPEPVGQNIGPVDGDPTVSQNVGNQNDYRFENSGEINVGDGGQVGIFANGKVNGSNFYIPGMIDFTKGPVGLQSKRLGR
nr:hypothetical protein 100 [Pelagibacteraceae bacterium]